MEYFYIINHHLIRLIVHELIIIFINHYYQQQILKHLNYQNNAIIRMELFLQHQILINLFQIELLIQYLNLKYKFINI